MKIAASRFISMILLCTSFTLISCEEETNGSNSETVLEDSLAFIPGENSRGLETSAMRPELIGTWKWVDMRLGNEPMAQEIPVQYLEFLASGKVANYPEGFAPDTSTLSQNGDMLKSNIWDNPQRIDSLSATRLILVETTDGTEISYIYERQ
ncbi:MAG: hypothetical protein NWR72_11075 [Bacteroidia bacterium]|nr:hypothetical protein [Bacteroidia bacterium]